MLNRRNRCLNELQKKEVLQRIAIGEKTDIIGADYGITGQAIRNIKKRNKELVELEAERLLEKLPDIIDATRTDIEINKYISGKFLDKFQGRVDEVSSSEEDLELMLEYKKVNSGLMKDVLKSVGIFMGSGNTVLSLSYNDNRVVNNNNNVISEVVLRMFQDTFINGVEDESISVSS